MISAYRPTHRLERFHDHQTRCMQAIARASSSSLASSLIENLAVLILKSRLAKYDQVKVQVEATSFGLIQGKIDGVTIQGTDWASPVALTSRYLSFSLGRTAIDYQALLMERRISLLPPKPEGQATILFSASDFGNFLRHPLFRAAASKAVNNGPFEFDGASVRIEKGSVLFSGAWSGETFDLCLRPNESEILPTRGTSPMEAVVRLTARSRGSGGDDEMISSQLAAFFNFLCMDLQGVQLRFSSLNVIARPQDQQDPLLLEMKLKASLISVPPLDIQF